MAKQPIINSLTEKVKRLIDQSAALEARCAELDGQNEKLKAEVRELREQLVSSQREVSKLELGGGFAAGSTDNKRARARINQLMREIDRCLTLINKED